MKILYTAHARVITGRDGSGKTDDGRLDVKLGFPKEIGGDGNGTNPEQLFAIGHAACFGTSLGLTEKAENKPLTDIEIKSSAEMILTDDEHYDLAVYFEVKARGQDRATIEDLIEKTKDVCAYSRATKGQIRSEIKFVE